MHRMFIDSRLIKLHESFSPHLSPKFEKIWTANQLARVCTVGNQLINNAGWGWTSRLVNSSLWTCLGQARLDAGLPIGRLLIFVCVHVILAFALRTKLLCTSPVSFGKLWRGFIQCQRCTICYPHYMDYWFKLSNGTDLNDLITKTSL